MLWENRCFFNTMIIWILCFTTHSEGNKTGQLQRMVIAPCWPTQAWFPPMLLWLLNTPPPPPACTTCTSQETKSATSSSPSRTTSNSTQNEVQCMAIVRRALTHRGVPKQANAIILNSWRKCTKSQYFTHINKEAATAQSARPKVPLRLSCSSMKNHR